MQKLPKQLHNLFLKITNDFPNLLGDNLVGIYLYGSLTYKVFNEKTSDVDCVVVIDGNLSDSEFRNLKKWYKETAKINPWVKRLEMTFLIKKDILTKNSKMSIYHNGLFSQGLSDGNPIIWLNILKNGITLYGVRPRSFVPKINKKVLRKALKLEVEYLREEIRNRKSKFGEVELSYQVYAVLTLCRILYTLRNDKIVSKERAGKWCIKHLPKHLEEIAELALKNITKAKGRPNPIIENHLLEFVDFIYKEF